MALDTLKIDHGLAVIILSMTLAKVFHVAELRNISWQLLMLDKIFTVSCKENTGALTTLTSPGKD